VEECRPEASQAAKPAYHQRLTDPAGVDGTFSAGTSERIGPYRLVRELGRGGMGIVYLAERDDGEYKQFVAIKILQRSAQQAAFTKLFWRERQILAQLEHPNIARLLQGGTTANGQPYYAMEFVEGVRLQQYCADHDLDLRQKLELFLEICAAVSYAHRKLVIHRDLKPQNILITAEGRPKLLDFGLAKLLEPDSPPTESTTAVLLLTPSYASPEQLTGLPLTVATDIYSLGVVLYELLCGEHPYGEAKGPIGAACAVLEQPPRPFRQTGIKIPADLEKIVFVALRKEAERRYASVDAFAEDIRRYLKGYPVQAAGDSLTYRSRKFFRRNRWAVMIVLLAFAGLVTSADMIWQAKQNAELRFQQVRRLAHAAVFDLHDAIVDLPGSTAARKLIVAQALEYLNTLAKERGNDTALTLELAQAYIKVGNAQGDPQEPNLGDPAGALASYMKARTLLLDLRRKEPSNSEIERLLGSVDEHIADVLPRTQITLILRHNREAVEVFDDLARKDTGLKALQDSARAHFYLAEAMTGEGDYRRALREWQLAQEIFSRIAKAEPDSDNAQRNLALAEKRLAGVYYALDDCTHSIVHDQTAAAIDAHRMELNPHNETARTDLSFDWIEIGSCLENIGERQAALEILQRTVLLRRSIAREDLNDARAQQGLEEALRVTAGVEIESGHIAKALILLHEALAIGLKLTAKQKQANEELANLGLDYYALGMAYRKAADWRSALAMFTRAEKTVDPIPARAIPDPHDRKALARLPQLLDECRRNLSQIKFSIR
jgi:tetratricopeptide (TPR) repeat protein/predicted Ser/Thr protein kinase